jgi:hypothetical protein
VLAPKRRFGVTAAVARYASAAPPRAVRAAAAAPAETLPWRDSMAARWSFMLGGHPESERIMSTIARSLAPTTAQSYGRHVANFVRWCEAQPDAPCPLPALTSTVLRWLEGDVCVGEKVREGSLQPYLSALNRVHRDHEHDEPALGHLVSVWRRGLAHRQGELGRDAERVYLPAPVMLRVAEWALGVDCAHASAATLALLRAAVASVFTFSFFARGATGARLLAKHVRRSEGGLHIALESEKGKATRARSRTITLPPGSVPVLERLLAKWEAFRGDADGGSSYYLLPGERQRGAFAARMVDEWLRQILAHLGVEPPAGELWSGHSLRKGAASASAAIGVSLDRICWCGGWSIRARAVHDYIDPTCPHTAAGVLFFGWLRPPR